MRRRARQRLHLVEGHACQTQLETRSRRVINAGFPNHAHPLQELHRARVVQCVLSHVGGLGPGATCRHDCSCVERWTCDHGGGWTPILGIHRQAGGLHSCCRSAAGVSLNPTSPKEPITCADGTRTFLIKLPRHPKECSAGGGRPTARGARHARPSGRLSPAGAGGAGAARPIKVVLTTSKRCRTHTSPR
jgi:hypothetical protein